MRYSYVHSDLNFGNYKFNSNGKIVALYDFNLAQRNERIFEFGSMFFGAKGRGLIHLKPEMLRALLRGYEINLKVPLTFEERVAIWETLRLRLMVHIIQWIDWNPKVSFGSMFKDESIGRAYQNRIDVLKKFDELPYVYDGRPIFQHSTIFGEPAEGKSMGKASFLDVNVLDSLVKPVNAWIDYGDIGNLSRAQINEVYKRAFRNPKKLYLVVYSSPSTDKHPLLNLPNIIFTPKSAVESIILVPKLENNIHLSRKIDPPSEFEKVAKDQFRYQNEENGLFGVALLYSQAGNREKFLEWYGLRKIGNFFSLVNEAILKLVQENENHLTVSRAA